MLEEIYAECDQATHSTADQQTLRMSTDRGRKRVPGSSWLAVWRCDVLMAGLFGGVVDADRSRRGTRWAVEFVNIVRDKKRRPVSKYWDRENKMGVVMQQRTSDRDFRFEPDSGGGEDDGVRRMRNVVSPIVSIRRDE